MNTSNNKKLVKVDIDNLSPSDLDGSLNDLRNQIEGLINKHGKDAKIYYDKYHHYQYDHEPSPRFDISIQREETDDEYNKRIEYESARKKAQEARDLAEYNRLKDKFK